MRADFYIERRLSSGTDSLKKSHFDLAPRGPEILPVQSALKIVSLSSLKSPETFKSEIHKLT